MRRLFFCFSVCLAVLCCCVSARAATFVVTSTADTDGSMCDVTCTLRQAINAANNTSGDDAITFASGVTGTITLSGALPALSSNIDLQGPGANTLTVARSTASGIAGFRIFSVSNGTTSGPTVSLSGLTLSNGNMTEGTFPNDSGGAIFNDHATLSLSDCTLSGNLADYEGGAIYNYGESGTARLSLTRCTLSGNRTDSYEGGAIFNDGESGSATLSLLNCTLSGNSAADDEGGAIFNNGRNGTATTTIDGCTFSGNTSYYGGGAIYNYANYGTATTSIANSTLSGNTSERAGGAVFNYSFGGTATLSLLNCTLSNNQARNGYDGGAIFNGSFDGSINRVPVPGRAKLSLEGSALNGNLAGYGGAIASENSTDIQFDTPVTLRNCTLSGNTGTTRGGAIVNFGGLMQLDSCTIAGNIGPVTRGAGVASYGDTRTRTVVRNSIIASNTNGGNSASNSDVDFIDGQVNSFQSDGFNLIGTGNATGTFNGSGDDIIGGGDPGLGPLASNGGPTQTIALLVDSPALDSGDTSLTVDQRGRPRPQGAGDDKGAFEAALIGIIVTTLSDEDNGSPAPSQGSGTSLREAINAANTSNAAGANAGVIITFSNTTAGGATNFFDGTQRTISLNSALPALGTSVALRGPGAKVLTVARSTATATGNFRIFTISNGTASGPRVKISALTLSNGNTGSDGGGIFNDHGVLTVDRCTLSGNHGGTGGAINNGGTLTLSNSTLSGNIADNGGGGLYSAGGSGFASTLSNCTVSGNMAGTQGGGVFNSGAPIVIQSSTITLNTAPGGGSGVFSSGDTATRTAVGNSLIAANGQADVDSGTTNSFASDGFNLIGTGSATSAFAATGDRVIGSASPGLGSLADNGGPTKTHALLASSPAINAGNTPLSVDQRGVSRPQGTRDDIGAYEFNAFNESLVVTTTSDEDSGTSDPAFGGGTSLREALNFANSNPDASIISFAPGVTGSITLASALPNLNTNLTLNGPGANVLTVARSTAATTSFRIFSVSNGTRSGPTVGISGLTISNGNPGGGNGGGVFNDHGALTISKCTLSGNSASQGGGLASEGSNGSATLILSNSTLSGNSASFGGGIYNVGFSGSATLSITNCTLSGNSTSTFGGGIYNEEGGALTVVNATLSGNSASNSGGGIYNSGTLSLGNTILNAGASGTNLYNIFGTTTSQGNNLSSDDTGPNNGTTDKISTNPMLDTLKDNGGPTQTHAPLAGSPAINAGSNTLATNAGLSTDQRGTGFVRISGGAVDIGAFEVQAQTPPPTVSIGNASVAEGNTVGGNLVFPVTLSAASASNVILNYALAPGTATASDYGTAFDSDGGTPGVLTIPAGSTTGSISVPVVGDTTYEANESLSVTLSNASGAMLGSSSVGSGIILNDDAPPSSSVIMSEFRLSGPGGISDEFIELANTSSSSISLTGYTLSSSDGTLSLSSALSGKIIPAGGHLLLTNGDGYSLSAVAAGDASYTGNIALNASLTLKDAGGNVVDYAGNLNVQPSSPTNQYAFVRRLEKGFPLRTGTSTDAGDFNLVDTSSTVSTADSTGVAPMMAPRLGAPGPQNSASPIQRNNKVTLVPLAASVGTPTEGRYASKGSALDSPNGRLTIRRTLTNKTGSLVTRLRFRIVAATSGTSTSSGVADLRALTSAGVTVGGTKVVQGITLDSPSTPTVAPTGFGPNPASSGNGGGLNSSWTVDLSQTSSLLLTDGSSAKGGIPAGKSINVEFLFAIVSNGTYRFVVDSELLP